MIFIEEIWKPIEGYENYYISNLGNVKNIKGKLLCLWKDNVGYLQVVLRKNKKKKHLRVHRLVAEAFIPNPDNLLQVNHKDSNKINNNVLNLEWITNQDNTKEGYKNNNYHSKHRCIKIEVYDKNTNKLINTYKSIRETAEKLNINRKTLSRILFNNKENNYNYNFKPII